MKKDEYDLEQRCCDYARKNGIAAVKLEGQNGIPDRLFISRGGKCLFIEFKKQDGSGIISKEQKFWLKFLGENGMICNNFDDFVEIINKLKIR